MNAIVEQKESRTNGAVTSRDVSSFKVSYVLFSAAFVKVHKRTNHLLSFFINGLSVPISLCMGG